MVSTTKIEEIIRELKKAQKPMAQLTILGSLQVEAEVLIKQVARSIK